ncbi:MAG: hypothetical protein HND56_11480 [Pseudomonadota bacterium]|nr:hypothetical protein [Pseudomonadota bacterium]QKK06271.1 MAG: hypothetical protein HND56_11480 [Pseudomonadota bacterium]
MSVAAEIKKRLIGAFETALFIPSGIERFSGTPRETFISFAVSLISLPLSFVSTRIHPPIGTEAFSADYVFFVHFLSGLASFTIGFLMIYGFARFVTGGNTNRIWLYYTVSNWISLIFIPLGMLFMALRYYGVFEPKTLEDVMLVLRLYGYGIGGYMIYRIFKPPVELAGALVCFILVMGQVVLKGAYTLGGLPNVDYMERYGPSAVQEAALQEAVEPTTPETEADRKETPAETPPPTRELMEN